MAVSNASSATLGYLGLLFGTLNSVFTISNGSNHTMDRAARGRVLLHAIISFPQIMNSGIVVGDKCNKNGRWFALHVL